MASNKTKQEILNVLGLKHAEQQACFNFAMHISSCDICRSSGHGRISSTSNLCMAGLESRDKSIAAARALAEVDQEFARKNAALIT